MAQYLKIHELSGINASSIPHLATTGDDRGGIAITEDNIFVTGEDATGVFAQDLLTPAASTGVVYDGIFSDLATGALFTLATDATTPVVAGATEITHIIPLDPDDGTPGTAIALSQPIVVSALGGNGIFVSLGRVVIYSNVDNGAYEIDLTTPNIGTVTDIGHIPRPDMEDTDQGWASWGVAEFFDGVTHLAYVADDAAVPDAIMRTAVPSGDTEVIGTLRGLADMASFTVSPDDGRWYFHFEDGGSGSQFGVLEGSSGNEFVGFADAIIATNAALAGDGNSNTIAGTASEDIISGGGGGDSLAGLAGDDALVGDGGDDTLDGGVDDDQLLGGGGDDSLAGGNGSDIAVFSGKFLDYHIVGLGNGEYSVQDLRAGSPDGTDTLSGIEELRFFDTNPIAVADLPFISRESEDIIVPTAADPSTGTVPKAAGLQDGRFIAVWESTESGAEVVRGRIFNADGTPDPTFDGGSGAGNDFVINTTTPSASGFSEVDVVLLSDGRFVVVWNEDEVRGRIFNADGTPDLSVNGGDDFVINTETDDDQSLPTVAALEDGRFVVAWQSSDDDGDDTSGGTIRAIVYGADGLPDPDVNVGEDFVVNSTFANVQSKPEIVALQDGGFFVAWQSNDGLGADGSELAIRGRFFEADGDPDPDLNGGNDFIVNTTFAGSQEHISAARLTDGRLVVAWSSRDQLGADESDYGVRARVFRANGTPDTDVNGGDDFLVNISSTVGIQADPSVSALPDGGFAIVWQDISGDGSFSGSRLRVFGADADPKGPDVLLGDVIVGGQAFPTLTTLQDGNLLAIWFSGETVGGGSGDFVRVALVDPTSPASLGGDLVGSVQEDIDLVDTGTIIITDADPTETEVVAQTGVAGTYGSFSITAAGTWTYTLNNALPAVQSMPQGGILFDQFDVESADGSAMTLVTVAILGTNEAPTIVGPSADEQSAILVDENVTAVADVDATDSNAGAVLTYSLAGGADEAKFSIDPATGTLKFLKAPDFEAPADTDNDNIYQVVVAVTDAEGGVDTQTIDVVVGDVEGQKLKGGKKGDILNGGVEADTLIGSGGKDKLFAKGGNDFLSGGARGDKLSGGDGSDTFDYDATKDSRPGSRDVITDYEDNDVIDLRGIDAHSGLDGNQTFIFVGSKGFSDHTRELRFEFAGSDKNRVTIVEGDVNGDGKADFAIELTGRHVLAADDFVL